MIDLHSSHMYMCVCVHILCAKQFDSNYNDFICISHAYNYVVGVVGCFGYCHYMSVCIKCNMVLVQVFVSSAVRY